MRDIAQMAKQSGFVSLLDLGIQQRRIIASNRRDKVFGMSTHAVRSILLFHLFTASIQNGVATVIQLQRSIFPVETDPESSPIQPVAIATQTFPDNLPTIREFERDHVSIGSLLIIRKGISTTR